MDYVGEGKDLGSLLLSSSQGLDIKFLHCVGTDECLRLFDTTYHHFPQRNFSFTLLRCVRPVKFTFEPLDSLVDEVRDARENIFCFSRSQGRVGEIGRKLEFGETGDHFVGNGVDS